MRNKDYTIHLSEQRRTYLLALIKKRGTSYRRLVRAHVPLLAHGGAADETI